MTKHHQDNYSMAQSAMFSLSLNTSRVDDSTTSLGNPFQYLITLL